MVDWVSKKFVREKLYVSYIFGLIQSPRMNVFLLEWRIQHKRLTKLREKPLAQNIFLVMDSTHIQIHCDRVKYKDNRLNCALCLKRLKLHDLLNTFF